LLNAKSKGSVRNGLAVVSIERGASAGSFFYQSKLKLLEKKIITDEHSGRILVEKKKKKKRNGTIVLKKI
jgi:hypothetical protein